MPDVRGTLRATDRPSPTRFRPSRDETPGRSDVTDGSRHANLPPRPDDTARAHPTRRLRRLLVHHPRPAARRPDRLSPRNGHARAGGCDAGAGAVPLARRRRDPGLPPDPGRPDHDLAPSPAHHHPRLRVAVQPGAGGTTRAGPGRLLLRRPGLRALATGLRASTPTATSSPGSTTRRRRSSGAPSATTSGPPRSGCVCAGRHRPRSPSTAGASAARSRSWPRR